MPTRREIDHIPNCNFKVEISGVDAGPFMEVDGLESAIEVEEFADGDDLIVRKRPGRANYCNIILRRGFTFPSHGSVLFDWYTAAVNGQYDRKDLSIIILDNAGGEIMRYNITGAWPCRWRFGALSAIGNGTIIEEVEIAIEKIQMG
jgi:phage tail-like protein